MLFSRRQHDGFAAADITAFDISIFSMITLLSHAMPLLFRLLRCRHFCLRHDMITLSPRYAR